MMHDNTTIQAAHAALIAHLTTHTQQLAAHGGPPTVAYHAGTFDAMPGVDPIALAASPARGPCYEVYYPLGAVLQTLELPLALIREDWHTALHEPAPLPLVPYETREGHCFALVAQAIVLDQLMWLSDAPVAKAYQQALEDARVRSYPANFEG